MNRKIKSLAAVAVGAVVALSGCHFVGKPNDEGVVTKAEKGSTDNVVLAELKGQKITLADFNFFYYNTAYQYQQYAYVNFGATDWEGLKYDGLEKSYEGMTLGEQAKQNAIDRATLFALGPLMAKEYDIEIDDDVVDKAEKQKKELLDSNFNGDEETYKDYLADSYISDYTYDKNLQRSYVVEELIDKLSQKGEPCYVSDEEVAENFIKASHVLIAVDEDTTDEQALEKANEVIARLDAGEDMAELIKEYGDDPGMESQSYYVFTKGEMVDEFYEGAKALAPDEYTKTPVKSSYGYHVIYRYPLTPADEGYEDVKSNGESVRNSLVMEKVLKELLDWSGVTVKVDEEAIEKALEDQHGLLDSNMQYIQQMMQYYSDSAAGDMSGVQEGASDGADITDVTAVPAE